jgi:hypothetical protein
MASVTAAGSGIMRCRVDPGRAFERYAELEQHSGLDGNLFTLTVSQRYRPSEGLHPVVSGEVHRDKAAEALWLAVGHADLLVPNSEYWRAGWMLQKPLWTAQADARQSGAFHVMEALAAVRARESGRPHFLSRMGHRAHCSVTAPHRGEFYSVNPEGEWSLHFEPVTYPLDGPPSVPPDRVGTHPAVMAHLRIATGMPDRRRMRPGPPRPPVVEFLGKAALPQAAWPPEKFYIPFIAKGALGPSPRAPGLPPVLGPPSVTHAAPGPPVTGPQPHDWNLMKEFTMPQEDKAPAEITAGSVAETSGPSTDDPWVGEHAEVRLAPEAAEYAKAAGLAQAGFVISIKDDAEAADRECTVHFPGRAGNISVPDHLLTPAPPFPAVTTSAGEIASIESAESLLIDATARGRLQQDLGTEPDPVLHTDRIKLAKALSNMCGMDPQELVRQLDPMITQQVGLYRTAFQEAKAQHPAGRKRASEVAAADIPKARPVPVKEQAQKSTAAPAAPGTRRPTSRPPRTKAV